MSIEIQNQVSLKSHTTLGVGGEAQFFVTVTSQTELVEAIRWAHAQRHSITILGGGSNTLVSDEGVEGLVIHIALRGITSESNGDTVLLTAQAGELLDDVVRYAVDHQWWGMENLSHIPGTVGATPIQNVGAYGVEVKDVIDTVCVFNTETMLFEVFKNADCDFRYRDSFFKSAQGKKYIVTSVTFTVSVMPQPKISYRDLVNLFEGTTPTLMQIREALISVRASKFPNWNEVGTAGSFFKNPIIAASQFKKLQEIYPAIPGFPVDNARVKVSLGWILDKVLHLRGYKDGSVATYEQQALVLVAERGATALEIENFANEIIEKIKNEIGIDVEWEVTKIK